jgi:hypothetical protein
MIWTYDSDSEKQRWRELLEAAQDDLLDTIQERDKAERRIRALQIDITHLAALCGVEVDDPVKQLGMTDAIRYILGSSSPHFALTPTEIRDKLEQSGYDISEYKNVMASIHTILRRLLKSKEVTQLRGRPGSYLWAGGLTPLPPSPQPKKAIRMRGYGPPEKIPE